MTNAHDQTLRLLLLCALAANGYATPMSGERQITWEWHECEPFDSAIPSVQIGQGEYETFEIEFRVKRGHHISPWFSLGRYGEGSIKSEPHDGIAVEVDVMRIEPPLATALQWRVTIKGGMPFWVIRPVTYRRSERKLFAASPSPVWGRIIPVPPRSQMLEAPELRGRICSPTSLAMVLEYYGINLPTAEVCEGVHDPAADIYGNWLFNTAYASQVGMEKLESCCASRFSSLEELEQEIAGGHPVIVSLRWQEGELSEATVRSSNGHLMVVAGFTENGDVVVNDPAANPAKGESVRRTYARRELYHCWLENAEGIVYLFRPKT